MRARGAAVVALACLLPVASASGGAARLAPRAPTAGDLDARFDGDGKALTDLAGGSDDRGFGVAVQRDGKTLVVGETREGAGKIALALVRYRRDGSLDPSFDADGKVRTDFGTLDTGSDVAVQPDGKVIALGVAGGVNPGASFDFALARYNPDGTLDATFDGDGKVVTDINGGRDWATRVALQADGRIVVAGQSRPRGSGPHDFAIVRYQPNGALDTSFDGDGKAITALSPTSDDMAFDVAVQPDGKIVAGGWSQEPGGASQSALVRYNADGSLDASLDGDGRLTSPPGTVGSSVYGLEVQRDRKIVTAGATDFTISRYNADGTLDTSFAGGRVVTEFPPDRAQAFDVELQIDGKIVGAGASYLGDFALARYTASGQLDRSFSGDGRLTTDIAGGWPGVADVAYALAIHTDRTITVAGLRGPPGPLFEGPYDIAVARYLGASPCIVPRVTGATLLRARDRVRKAHCKVGKIKRGSSRETRKGRVVRQSPRPGTRLPEGGKVNLFVSRGSPRSRRG